MNFSNWYFSSFFAFEFIKLICRYFSNWFNYFIWLKYLIWSNLQSDWINQIDQINWIDQIFHKDQGEAQTLTKSLKNSAAIFMNLTNFFEMIQLFWIDQILKLIIFLNLSNSNFSNWKYPIKKFKLVELVKLNKFNELLLLNTCQI